MLRCCPQPSLAPLITERDEAALAYLEDVAYMKGNSGMHVSFTFSKNPFFYDRTLRKGVFVLRDEATGQLLGAREEATHIHWKEGRSLLVSQQEAYMSLH